MQGTVYFYVLFWGVFVISLGLFGYRFKQLWDYMFLGQKESTAGRLRQVWNTLGYIFSQFCQLKNFRKKDRAPLGHALLVWGFFVSILFYFFFIILSEGLHLAGLEQTAFYFYFSWVMDFMAAFVFIGAAWALIRRFIIRPDRLKGEQTWEAFIILLSVLAHPITHFFEMGAKIALPAGSADAFFRLGNTPLPPISAAISTIFTAHIQGWFTGFFWAHWLTVVLVLILIPYTRYMHIIASLFNGILRNPQRMGTLRPIDLEKAESFGAGTIDNLTWKQNLDLYACVVCGNCQELCPAYNTGKPLNPKKVIQDLKNQLLKAGPALLKAKANGEAAPEDINVTLAGKVVTEDEIWACTTCGACDEVCPVWVEHIDKIIDLRRNLVMEQSVIPEAAKIALEGIEKRGRPWKGATKNRTDWAAGLDIKTMAEDANVDILFWVGCTEALEGRSVKVAQSLARVMQAAGVKFGILGDEETCCGDPRRLGNEYLYQILVQQNIETLKGYKVKKIVAACPHCFNTLKNEYPQFGGNFEVVHHTELIYELIKDGKLKLDKTDLGKITYHDSCYLGRHNQVYQPPRQILKAATTGKLIEMENNKKWGFCCGGGGGRMWLEEKIGTRINENRMDQILSTKADMVATACPYCLQMFDDAAKAKAVEEKVKIRDIVQIIEERIQK